MCFSLYSHSHIYICIVEGEDGRGREREGRTSSHSRTPAYFMDGRLHDCMFSWVDSNFSAYVMRRPSS